MINPNGTCDQTLSGRHVWRERTIKQRGRPNLIEVHCACGLTPERAGTTTKAVRAEMSRIQRDVARQRLQGAL